ncbi:uncharacterized protein [Parasteatoda tepidariorum]|uniref:uncharacterized protein isoform X1 n=2 Tax=Parasteatoda tepidariorum TaxID=114398 RepID=UPI001C72732F|nr:serine/arginine repetitive matrix protein 2 isoform X1 [Parasteatoda tepidariorum]XP_015903243.2 serine/arginine repetitive matrix protein 2 isoform X1 [Parasteatoda tepidariorum]
MENFYPGHPFARLPQPDMYNFRRNDTADYYNNLHVIPTNVPPPVHIPYFPPPVLPDIPLYQQQTSPTDSRIVKFKSKNKSNYPNRSRPRSNLIEVRSTPQPPVKVRTAEVRPPPQQPVKIRSIEPKPTAQAFVNVPIIESSSSHNVTETKVSRSSEVESKSPYKSHSYANERYSSLRSASKPVSSSSTYLDFSRKSFKSSRDFTPRDHVREHYDKYYHDKHRKNDNDKYKKRIWEREKYTQSKKYLNDKNKPVAKKQPQPDEAFEDVSDSALDDDFEEVEVVSGVEMKEKVLPIGFRKCKVSYLSTKRNLFYKPRIYSICPERTVIDYWNYDEEEIIDKEDDVIVTEEVYEMESEELTEEKMDLESVEIKKEVKIEEDQKAMLESVETGKDKKKEKNQETIIISSKTDPPRNTSNTDLKKQDLDDDSAMSRSYRICLPDISEFFQGEAIIQPDLDAWKSHLIGLSYIIEIRDKTDDTNILRHHCILCSDDIHAENDSGEMVIDHISSYKHMFKYLEKHFQSCGFKFTERIEESYNYRTVLHKCCEDICNKLGYDYMCITDDGYFEENIKAVLKMVNNIPHRCEKDIEIDASSYEKDVECDTSTVTSQLTDVLKDVTRIKVESISDQKTNKESDDLKKVDSLKKEIDSSSKQKTGDKSDDKCNLKKIPGKEAKSPTKQKSNDKSNVSLEIKNEPKIKVESPTNLKINDKKKDTLKMNMSETRVESLSKEEANRSNDLKKKCVSSDSNENEKSNDEKKALDKTKKQGVTAFSASKIAPFSLFSFGANKKGKNSSQKKNKSKPKAKVPKSGDHQDDDDGIEIIFESNPKPASGQGSATGGKKSSLDKIPPKASNSNVKTQENQPAAKKIESKDLGKKIKIEDVSSSKENSVALPKNQSDTQLRDKICDSEKQKNDLALNESKKLDTKIKAEVSPIKQKSTLFTEGQKIPVLEEPVLTPFKRKNAQNKNVRSQTNISNLKVLKEAEAVAVTIQTSPRVAENVSNNFSVTEFGESNKMSESVLINESKSSLTSSEIKENAIQTSIFATENEDTNISEAAYDELTDQDVSQQSDCNVALDDSQSSKNDNDKSAAEQKSPAKKKCCQHKHQHHHKTVHSKYCIKRIISRSKISKEASESSIDKELISSKDLAEISTSDDSKQMVTQKSADVADSKSKIRTSKSPERKFTRISSERRSRSPTNRYKSPLRIYSPISVSRYAKSHGRSRSISPRKRSRSPIRRRSKSPLRRYSRSPIRRYSRSPIRRQSRSPIRRQNRSPIRRRSRSPFRKQSRSPIRRRSRSPFRRQVRSPIRKRSISPFRKRSRSPFSKFSRSPLRKHSRSPLRLSSRRQSRSPIRRFSPVRRSVYSPKRARSRSMDRIQAIHNPQDRNLPRKRSRSSSPSRKLPRRYDLTKNVSPDPYTRTSSKHHGHKNSETSRSADLDPVSDEDESIYFNTSEKPQHIEEIMKLPEPTRSVISEMFKKFLSTSNVNPKDSSLLKFMQFMNAHSGQVQEIMSSPGTSTFNNPISQKKNIIPHLGSALRPQLPPNLSGNQQYNAIISNPQNPLLAQNILSQSVSPFIQPQIFPGAVPNTHPMLNQFQQGNLNVFPPSSNPVPNQNPFQQQNPTLSSQYVAPGLMIQNLKNTVHKLFGSNENKFVGESQTKNILPRNNLPSQLNSGISSMSAISKPQPGSGNWNLLHNSSKSNVVPHANTFAEPVKSASFQDKFDNNSTMGRDRSFQRNEPFGTNNVINPGNQPGIPVPPPDARVSFCNVPSSSSNKNLFPVVSNANTMPNFNSKTTQANVSDVKKSLAQRLAAVLVKVGMVDVPAPLLQEMLMKIGAFSSCPPQDITEGEILNILRRLGYV